MKQNNIWKNQEKCSKLKKSLKRQRNTALMKKEQDRGFWFKMTENKYVHLSPTARAQKLQLVVEQPSAGGRWNPTTKKKDTTRPKTKKQLQRDGRGGTITIKSNPIPAG